MGMEMDMSRVRGRIPPLVAVLVLFSAQAVAAEAPPRLKYRGKGPVCSCGSGLSEADIRRAMDKAGLDRLQAGSSTEDGPAVGSEGQTRRETDEERK